MKSLFVPKELVGVFLSTSKSAKEWSDPSFLQGILSPLDVAIYLVANVQSNDLIGGDLVRSFPNEIVECGPEKFGGLGREIDIEMRRLCAMENYNSNGMVPAVAYFDGTHVFFTLTEPVEGVSPIEAIIGVVADSVPFEVLAKLPAFGSYLTQRQKVLQ